jgi:hypothetical protein
MSEVKVATHLDERMVSPPSLVVAENVVWNRVGKTTKRGSLNDLTAGLAYSPDGSFLNTAMTESHGLFAYNDGVISVDKNGVAFNYTNDIITTTPSGNAGAWVCATGGPFGFGKISQDVPITSNSSVVWACDQAVASGFVCYVWFEPSTSTTWVSVKSTIKNAIVQQATSLGNLGVIGGYAKVIVVGSKFAVVHTRTATVISVYLISPGVYTPYSTGGANQSVFDIATTAVAPNMFDCCSNESNSRGVLAFHSTAANGQVNILTFNNAGTVISASTAAFSGGITLGTFIAVCAENDGVNDRIGVSSFFTQGGTAGVRARIYDKVLANVAAATTIESGIATPIQNLILTWGGSSSLDAAFTGIAAAVTNQGTCLRHVTIVSKFFRYNGLTYLVVCQHNFSSSAAVINSYFIVSIDGNVVAAPTRSWGVEAFSSRSLGSDGVVGSFNRGAAPDIAVFRGFACQVQDLTNETGAGTFGLAVLSTGTAFTGSLTTKSFLSDTRLDLAFNNSAVEVNGVLYATGMQLSTYDGYTACEQGFHIEGSIVSISQSNGAGTLANGFYSYAVYPEWVNARGQTEIGTCIGFADITTTGANDTVTLTLRTHWLLNRRSASNGPVSFAVFRTISTDPTGPRYRISFRDPSFPIPLGAYNLGVYNDVNQDTVTFVDLLNDGAIGGNAVDYLSNGELDNIHIGRCSSIAIYKNRLCVSGGERRNTVFCSKKIKQEASQNTVNFNDGIVITIPEFGLGDITALAGLDEALIVFKENSCFYVTGDGPDDAGSEANSRFDTARLVSGDIGAIDQRTIVVLPMGVMFNSNKGIYLLKRDMQLEYVGQGVEAYNPITVKQAIVLPATQRVVFLTLNGPTLVYDYRINAWATWTGLAKGSNACILDSTFVLSTANATVLKQFAPGVDGASTAYSQIVETAWLKVAGPLQGRQLVNGINTMLERAGAHDLKITVYYDYSTTAAGTKTFPDAAGTIKQWHWDLPAPHQMQAVKLRFEDLAPGTSNPATTGGFNLIEVALEASRFMGLAELPLASRG